MVSLGILLSGQKRYVKVPPQSSAIVDAVKTVTIACREKGFQNAKPSSLSENHNEGRYKLAQEARYTDAYVDDVKRGVQSCKVSLYFNGRVLNLRTNPLTLDVSVLPILLHLLDSDMEQSYLPSWSNGAARYSERSSSELGSNSAYHLHPIP